jgi:hypothetical protein
VNKKRQWWIGVLILLVISSIAIPLKADNLTIELSTNEYQILDVQGGYQQIKMDGFNKLSIPGKPTLLARTFVIALPPGAKVSSVNITGTASVELPDSYKILPAPPALPMDNREDMVKKCLEEWEKTYQEVYSSDDIYPEKVGEYLGVGGLRKYTFVRVAFFPFGYKPRSGKLLFYPSATVSVDYSLPPIDEQRRRELDRLLSDEIMEDLASHLILNYPQTKEWYIPQRTMEKSLNLVYNYVIITTDALTQAVSALVNWKVMQGYKVNVVSTTWIESNYSGTDLQEKIRNFLIDKYVEWGIEYVLLVGNIDVIPMRHCYPDPSNHGVDEDYCPPTDYYYADLTGSWDSDGDGYYGEYGEDAVDFIPEVYVGRIPYSDAVTVDSICHKLVNFEKDTSSWKNNALLLGAMSNYQNEDYSGMDRTDGASLMELMISYILSSWSYTRMYEKAGLSPSGYACDFPLTASNVVSNWSSHGYGIVNWWAHGSPDVAWRKWWSSDDGDGVPESNEMAWAAFFSNLDVKDLGDSYPSIVFSCSCDNAWPEVDNLARRLLKQGSAGIVASTRISWYTIGWASWGGGNASIDYQFFYYMINNDEKVGKALFDSKIYYLNNYFWWGWESQENMFDFCLYGDPSLIREGTVAHFICGDANGDSLANVSDVIYLINYLFKGGKVPDPLQVANVNGDGLVNVSDVIYLINYLFKGGSAPVC